MENRFTKYHYDQYKHDVYSVGVCLELKARYTKLITLEYSISTYTSPFILIPYWIYLAPNLGSSEARLRHHYIWTSVPEFLNRVLQQKTEYPLQKAFVP